MTVWREVQELLAHPERVAEEYQRRLHTTTAGTHQEQATLEAQLGKVRQGLARLIDSYAEGLLEKHEFEPRITRLRQRILQLEEQRQQLIDVTALQTAIRLIVGRLEDFAAKIAAGLEDSDWLSKREMIRALVKRVEVTPDRVNVVFRVDPYPEEANPEKKVCNFMGGVVSPLFANIDLHEMDKSIESKYLNLTPYQRRRQRKKGDGNYLYIRYAADFIVLCNGTKTDAQQMKEELGGLLDNMGLTLSEEKTKLTHITEGFTFLGYKVIREVGTNGKMVPKVLIPESAMKKYRHKVRAALAPNTHKESINAKITALNRLTNGWCQYYKASSSPSRPFDTFTQELFWDMAHWLGRKFDITMPEVMKRYRKEHTFGTKRTQLVTPFEHKAKRLLTKTWHNPYTAKEAIVREKLLIIQSLWSGEEYRHGRMDIREDVRERKGTICAINGPDCASRGIPLHPSEVIVDHIRLRSKFKYPKDADRMDNYQILCTNCHRAKTKNDLEVLSRVR